ncbi:MAG: PCRF domain-containing protein, partial [Chloroflexi bacterium]|nr:PCRF domain-containing protein [Chloroflexota bacterium]
MRQTTCGRCSSVWPTCWCVFDEQARLARIAALQEDTADPSLWNDPARAQALLKQLSDLRTELAPWQELRGRLEEAAMLLELAMEEGDEVVTAEVLTSLAPIRREMDDLEFRLTLSGPYDRANAILSISAGAGGTDA